MFAARWPIPSLNLVGHMTFLQRLISFIQRPMPVIGVSRFFVVGHDVPSNSSIYLTSFPHMRMLRRGSSNFHAKFSSISQTCSISRSRSSRLDDANELRPIRPAMVDPSVNVTKMNVPLLTLLKV